MSLNRAARVPVRNPLEARSPIPFLSGGEFA
jgi:hypothetical protein